MDPTLIRFNLPKDNSDQIPISKPKVCKPKSKAFVSTDRETRSTIGSSKPWLRFINSVTFSHCYIRKVFNILKSENNLSLSQVKKLKTY